MRRVFKIEQARFPFFADMRYLRHILRQAFAIAVETASR
jgi:hypothetical protein